MTVFHVRDSRAQTEDEAPSFLEVTRSRYKSLARLWNSEGAALRTGVTYRRGVPHKFLEARAQ